MRTAFWLPLAWLLVSLALQVGWQGLSQNLAQKKTLRKPLKRLGGGLRPLGGAAGVPSLGKFWPLLKQFLRRSSEGWSGAAARFFYFVGLPYLALLSGVLTPRLLGLKGVEYFTLSGESGTASIQQALALTLLEWLLDSQLLIPLSLLALLSLAAIRWHLVRDRVEWAAPEISTLAVLYTGLHWAFYRAIFWAVTGDLYLGLVWGAGAVILEWLLVGWIQKQPAAAQPAAAQPGVAQPAAIQSGSQTLFGNQTVSQQPYNLQTIQTFFIQLMLLILTSLLFFYTPNLWLIWPVHLALLTVLAYQKSPELSARPLTFS